MVLSNVEHWKRRELRDPGKTEMAECGPDGVVVPGGSAACNVLGVHHLPDLCAESRGGGALRCCTLRGGARYSAWRVGGRDGRLCPVGELLSGRNVVTAQARELLMSPLWYPMVPLLCRSNDVWVRSCDLDFLRSANHRVTKCLHDTAPCLSAQRRGPVVVFRVRGACLLMVALTQAPVWGASPKAWRRCWRSLGCGA